MFKFKFLKKLDKVYDEIFTLKRNWGILSISREEYSQIELLKKNIHSLEEEIVKIHEYLGVNRQKNCTDQLVKKQKKEK